MAKFRANLPLLNNDRIYFGEGGTMTSFFFGEETKDIKVPHGNILLHFVKDKRIMKWEENYYRKFMDLCLKENDEFGFILFGFFQYKGRRQEMKEMLGIEEEEWIKLNKDYIQRLVDLRSEYETLVPNCPPIPIASLIAPKGEKGDAFSLETKMTIKEAEEYHHDQIKVIAEETKSDFLFPVLISYSEEAIGICNVAARYRLPVVICFTTGTDGSLASGESIKDSIRVIDHATGASPVFYMINCSHITHFSNIFEEEEGLEVIQRIGGIKTNGSKKSKSELNGCSILDTGDHVEFGELMAKLRLKAGSQLNCLSGCCGTDIRHLKETIKCLKRT